MRALCSLLLLLLLTGCALEIQAQKHKRYDSVDIVIRLNNRFKTGTPDSVLVILDRYDRAGAGIVKKFFYPADNEVVIKKVPSGRYYIEVYCMGIFQQSYTDISFFNARHSNVLTINLKPVDPYIPGVVFIPGERIDLNKLIINRPTLNR